ncbi:Hypothetical protein BFG00_0967 [Corynebacterium pseudotuberculosis]|nr:Hypothetical protein BFF96_0971 [Corynebacterium pseudotuberculosis]AUY60354.1 Hypothetical protein BFG00_0967 [Corynebacterium pseudotuberculosis]
MVFSVLLVLFVYGYAGYRNAKHRFCGKIHARDTSLKEHAVVDERCISPSP